MEYSRSCQIMQQWMWRKLWLICVMRGVMGWQPRVCMRMRNT